MKPTKALADLLTACSNHDHKSAIAALEYLTECFQGAVTYWPYVPEAIRDGLPSARRYALMGMLSIAAEDNKE